MPNRKLRKNNAIENLSVRLFENRRTIPRTPKLKFKIPIKFKKKLAPLLNILTNLKIINANPDTIANNSRMIQ